MRPDNTQTDASWNTQASDPLVDRFGRVHTSIRISVTDRCNIRCQYCMPEENVKFMDNSRLLSYEQIARLISILATVGVRKVRITGGEPLVRRELGTLVRFLSSMESIDDVALTTNGMLLAEQAGELAAAGLQRVNISIDTLREATFQLLARRSGIDRVLAGIAAARKNGLRVRLNTLVLRQINMDDVIPLVDFARDADLPLRFIEFMPLDADRRWQRSEMVSGQELRDLLADHYGELKPAHREDPNQPATDYEFIDGRGMVGFIDSVSQPFCSDCNRLRLTADGHLKNCLFGREDWNVGELLRANASADEILQMVRAGVWAKHASHGISEEGFQPPPLAMYQIGG